MNWTDVLVTLIAGLPSTIAAIGTIYLARQIRTPSKRPIGEIAERTHHLAETNTVILKRVHRDVNGDADDTDVHDLEA